MREGFSLCGTDDIMASFDRYPGLFMNRSAFFKIYVCEASYGYVAKNTAQISRHALACGSLELRENRRLAPGG